MKNEIKRCSWADYNKVMQKYHDEKWGKPVFDDKELFKMLCLECMQAGLSWITILNKMDALCKAFNNFDPKFIISYNENKEKELLQNESIIRNRLKIKAVITNAKAYFKICDEFGSFSNYLWNFINYEPIINFWQATNEIPTNTELSSKISKDLKKRGFSFVGPTIIYSFIQAIGMVDDHILECSFKVKR